MSGKRGAALGVTDQSEDKGPDVDGFNIRTWIKGTATVTRSVEVCGRPQLMGAIEALKAELERTQASTDFDDDRPLAKSATVRLAEQLEAARREMFDSIVVFKFRGLRTGEFESIKKEHGEEDSEELGSDLDYKIWARQCVQPAGVTWQDLKDMHRGNDAEGIEGLGGYFLNTIGVTATAAAQGRGVDVPFSSASSSLIASSSKS